MNKRADVFYHLTAGGLCDQGYYDSHQDECDHKVRSNFNVLKKNGDLCTRILTLEGWKYFPVYGQRVFDTVEERDAYRAADIARRTEITRQNKMKAALTARFKARLDSMSTAELEQMMRRVGAPLP